MPEAIIIGGPLDGRRVFIPADHPKFFEAEDDKGSAQIHFEVSAIWLGSAIEDRIFVHSSLHRDGFDLMQVLIAGYRRPGA